MDEDHLEGVAVQGNLAEMRQLFFERAHRAVPDPQTDRRLVNRVMEHARQIVAHPSRPIKQVLETFDRLPFGEFALEESLEESPLLHEAKDLLVTLSEEKQFSCVTMLDASSSMTGEKHLLASVAVAVLLLEVNSEDASVIVFASDAKTIKPLRLKEQSEETILKFLKNKPRGFTNIAEGLEMGLKELKARSFQKRRVGLIATDGRTTEGKDPVEVATLYDFLVVLHLHGPGSHIEASKEMAQAGHGVCLEVEKFEELPRRLYDAIRMMARL